ncbi:rhombosortase [Solimonas fluminis]|uniref:Rhombosortase n=1 Tax=Solimonas fluminis TaxID=2086571 RepID=A0A2S5TDU0_9GAMM|nr:rhombosortase [Solimonas fluminis]
MIADSIVRSGERWAVPAGVALLCLLLALGGDPVRDALAYQREAVAAGQWWRLLGANFLHLGWYHLLLNLLGLWTLLLLCPEPLPARTWLLRLLVLGLAVTLGIHVLAPQWRSYVGFSGILHGLFLLGLLPQALRRDGIALAALACLAAKLAWEAFSGTPISDEQALGGRVAQEAHWFGIIAALCYAAIAGLLRQRRPAAA